jgi:serine/threonine-protein kinase
MDPGNLGASPKETPAAPEAAALEIPENYQHLVPAGRILARQMLTRGPLNGKQASLLFPHREMALVLGRFLLLERLGQDGTGPVWRALHVLMEREVAIRLLVSPGKRSPQQRSRFWKEVQLAAHLRHPNLVTVFDVVEVAGLCVLVMEYISGLDLNTLVAQLGRLPITDACSYIRQAALGLQAAHDQRIVHGDVQPARLLVAHDQTSGSSPNVLLPEAARTGVVKIMNLGLAWRNDVSEGGDQIGPCHPDYVAPEQAKDPRRTDARSDLYSLGCTLYFALTGRPPFARGSAVEKPLKAPFAKAPPVARLRPDIPRVLAAVVERLLARKPDDRFQVASELAEALAPFCPTHRDDRPGWSRPDSSFYIRTPLEPTGPDTNPVVAMTGGSVGGPELVPPHRPKWPFLVLCATAALVGLGIAWLARFLLDIAH